MFKRFLAVTILVVVSVVLLTACGSTAPAAVQQPAAQQDSDKDGIPDNAEALLGTDAQNPDTDGDGQNDLADANPLQLDNPIVETSTQQGFSIDTILVENNVDDNGVGIADHLELTVTNSSAADISGFDLYYTFTDSADGTVQSFYQKLPDLTIKAGETTHLHFDLNGAAGHFRADPNSLFYTGQNALTVEATLHAAGFSAQTASIAKDAPGAEGGGD